MNISVAELKTITEKALKNQGYNDTEIATISEVLMYAQLRGNNQGVVKLVGKGMPKDTTAGEIITVKETKLSALLNGNKNQGMVVMDKALNMLLEKATEHGFAIVGSNNTYTSTGAIGYYAEKIARKGLIGYVFAGSPPTVTTHGSYQPLFGTNPLAIGIPTTKDPIVLDMATAAMAFFGLVQASLAGQAIPGNVAYDDAGNLTTDPNKGMDGSILPFDRSYKGAGLALINEILTGVLTSASFVGINPNNGWGNVMYAIDPELLGDREEFAKKATQLVETVKSAKKLPGVTEIYLPGEKGNAVTKKHVTEGMIEVEDNLLQQLKAAAK